MPIASKKALHKSWTMYDWANSAYNLIITSTIFPAYYTAITTQTNEQGQIVQDTVQFLGLSFKNSSLFNYVVAFAYLVVVLLSPWLAGKADAQQTKAFYMKCFAFMGSITCGALFFFTKSHFDVGMLLFMLAAIGYSGSLVFYNAFLPVIASVEERDMLSARGFIMGYIGSVLLQLLCLVFVLNDGYFSDATLPARLSFLMVGLWWLYFSWRSIRVLQTAEKAIEPTVSNTKTGWQEIWFVFQQIRANPLFKRYLTVFFLYNMGVQTVMLAAAIFASKEIGLQTSALIITILIIQLVAIPGAWLMAKLAGMYGNLKVLMLVVLLWVGVCICAYYTYSEVGFYAVAALVGIVMGGIQSLSRSTYAKWIPSANDTTSYFSFYDITEKLSIVIGMAAFGLVDQLTDMRTGTFLLGSFFILGFLGLLNTYLYSKKSGL